MNAVEIESAVSDLAHQPFDKGEFPFAFLAAFGNKETTLKRLRKGDSNASDISGCILQRNHIHIAVCPPGTVGDTLKALKDSPKTKQAKAKFVLATDGVMLEAEDLIGGDTIACEYTDFPDHFGFFLPLAGISTIKEIKDNPIDVRATGRLNKLYIELLRENPDWAMAERRADMNHFMARLIFCFFAEDTDIFDGDGLFTRTVEQMSERDGGNTHEVLSTLFRAMNLKSDEREAAGLPRWAMPFPYVNGGLFDGSADVPRFTRTARSYLFQAGQLNWAAINPDIFGSMIQAVADDEERGALGMHYTSVPNILKVLNPLFLDELRAQLEAAGDNKAKLLNLRKRMTHIRVFDPACGSGNFLVIAYKQMRAIEAVVNQRRSEADLKSEIPINNFRGIELREFPAEIARLALIIAEFQCDVLYRGQKEALKDVLPLDAQNWIVCGNALRLDWLAICPAEGTGVKLVADDLFNAPLNQAKIDFENKGGEIYICGNPPYLGARAQTQSQKEELEAVLDRYSANAGVLDYVAGWFVKAAEFSVSANSAAAFVSTNSICQGQHSSVLWPIIFGTGNEISFAHTSFKWTNLASQKAAVTVIVVGISQNVGKYRTLLVAGAETDVIANRVENINPYLAPTRNIFIHARSSQVADLPTLDRGSAPTDDGTFFFDQSMYEAAVKSTPSLQSVFHRAVGGADFIRGTTRWIAKFTDVDLENEQILQFATPLLQQVTAFRNSSKKAATKRHASSPHVFPEDRHFEGHKIFVPQVLSENRKYITAGLLGERSLVLAPHFQCPATDILPLAILSSRLHAVWVETVCGKLKTDIRYSNTLGWNTFPAPTLTDQNKTDLTRCAEDILLAREAHFPKTIADLYDPEDMPDNLRRAHERNDEVLERIYIGRRFRNDTERLEKLFELYTAMTAEQAKTPTKKTRGKRT
ncbi:MAG: DNA methyltransferase [Lysobacteraceae bacterium]